MHLQKQGPLIQCCQDAEDSSATQYNYWLTRWFTIDERPQDVVKGGREKGCEKERISQFLYRCVCV